MKLATILLMTALLILTTFNTAKCDDGCSAKTPYCKGRKLMPDGAVYEGEFRFGKPNGFGKLRFTDGTVYEGEFMAGVRSGQGTQHYYNGDVYKGQWADDQMNGQGEYRWANGATYQGNYVAGLMHGQGVVVLANACSYEGKWRHGAANGAGVFTQPDGSRYIGKFKDNLRHGAGVLAWPTNDELEGKWAQGLPVGRATLRFSSGASCQYDWSFEKSTQNIVFVTKNGRIFEGSFEQVEQELRQSKDDWRLSAADFAMAAYVASIETQKKDGAQAADAYRKQVIRCMPEDAPSAKFVFGRLSNSFSLAD
jgi:hypothetical protein